jgi:hypothetical protein
MHRRVLACLLSVLLLLMQQEALWHALGHVGAQLQRVDHAALERPVDACAECQLLAGGSAQIAHALDVLPLSAPAWHVAGIPLAIPTAAVPPYYRSRAPPAFLQHA